MMELSITWIISERKHVFFLIFTISFIISNTRVARVSLEVRALKVILDKKLNDVEWVG